MSRGTLPPSSIPAEMRAERRWLVWRAEPDPAEPDQGGRTRRKVRKPPYDFRTGRRVDSNNADAFGTFEDASAAMAAHGYTGIGYALSSAALRVAVDLDDCRNPETGEITETALAIVRELDSYTEISPSGCGLKVFVKAAAAAGKKRAGLEILTSNYSTVTGHHLEGTPTTVNTRGPEIAAIIAREFGTSGADTDTPRGLPDVIPDGTKNNALFREACALRQRGHTEDSILAALTALNEDRQKIPTRVDARELQSIAKSASRYAPGGLNNYPTTETGDAEAFAALYGARVRYNHSARTWLLFEPPCWQIDPIERVKAMTIDLMRARQDASQEIRGEDRATRRARVRRWAVDGEKASRITNTLKIAQALPPIADDGKGWDTDPWLLAVANGVLDLRTGTLRDGTPEDRLTLRSPVAYDPDAQCPRFVKFVDEISSTPDGHGGYAVHRGLPAFWQQSLGAFLTGDTSGQQVWVWYGLGANGKTTLLELVNRVILPQHAWAIPFPTEGWSDAMTEYQTAKLYQRRVYFAVETKPGKRLNTELVKKLSGGDTLNARHPYGQPFTFTPTGKMVLAVNHKPIVQDKTHSFWRRVFLMPFERTFTIDPTVPQALAAEAAGILAWMVRGCLDWQANGFDPPAVVTAGTKTYQEESDTVARFLAAKCVVNAEAKVQAGTLFNAYRSWCEAERIPEPERESSVTFPKRIKDTGVETTGDGKHKPKTYHGVGLLQGGY